jgi:site-specific DNA recombinase
MAELVPMNLKKKAGKCSVMETEAVSKTNNVLLKAVVKAHLWKHQLEGGKHGSVRELSTKINISKRCIEQIIRLNDLAPKIKEDKVNRRQPSSLRLAGFREIPMLWSEKLEKF